MRIGRFGDPCNRIRVGDDGGSVDRELQTQYTKLLGAFLVKLDIIQSHHVNQPR